MPFFDWSNEYSQQQEYPMIDMLEAHLKAEIGEKPSMWYMWERVLSTWASYKPQNEYTSLKTSLRKMPMWKYFTFWLIQWPTVCTLYRLVLNQWVQSTARISHDWHAWGSFESRNCWKTINVIHVSM